MPRSPVDLQQEATDFYATRDFDVSYFPAIWHTFKVGHLLTTDLERICRDHQISIADFHLLGAIIIEGPRKHRAIDLAQRLNVSNAVLSTRIKKLVARGLLIRTPSDADRRAFELTLTDEGLEILRGAGGDIAQFCNFVRCFHQLPTEDQAALVRIMGTLHNELDRFALSAGRGQV